MFKFKSNKKYDELKKNIDFLKEEKDKLQKEVNKLKEKFKYVEIEEKIVFNFGWIFSSYSHNLGYNLYFIDSSCDEFTLNCYDKSNMKLKEYFIKKINKNIIIIGVQFNYKNDEDKNEQELIEYFIFNQNDKVAKKIDNDLFTEMSRSNNNYNWIEYKGEE